MNQETPSAPLPHLGPEFYGWLWFTSEAEGGSINLGESHGVIDVWVDERLAFQAPGEAKTRAIMTGENTSSSPEALAAMASGKQVREIQVHIRHGEHEYQVTLKGTLMDVSGLKLPPLGPGEEDDLVCVRMELYEELWSVIAALYRRFAVERTRPSWASETLPAMRGWVSGTPA
jgi:hypothetical protein